MDKHDLVAFYGTTLQGVRRDLTADDLQVRYPTAVSATDAPVGGQNCQFYGDFFADPALANTHLDVKRHEQSEVQADLSPDVHYELKKHRRYDFRLLDHEQEKLMTNGFVVSQHWRGNSFGEIYSRLFTDDMPVFVTTDSVLHAWHRSFDALVIDMEKKHCSKKLKFLLETLINQSTLLYQSSLNAPNKALSEVVLSVDLYLALALSLLGGQIEHCLPALTSSTQLQTLWDAVQGEVPLEIELFGSLRDIDFSLFKPRGHYSATKESMQYYQALTWLGAIDFHIAGGKCEEDDLYQLKCALLLVHLLQETQMLRKLTSLDALMSNVVGQGGIAMTPLHLSEHVSRLSTKSIMATYFPQGGIDKKELLALQEDIVLKGHGKQQVNAPPRQSGRQHQAKAEVTVLPTTFSLLGQKFVWSSFIFSRVVDDHVAHFAKDEIARRLPSAVDVAFTLFANDAASDVLAQRMTAKESDRRSEFVKFRDGVSFTSKLLAVRATVEHAFDENTQCKTHDKCVSTLWLEALRELSKQSPNPAAVFQSHEWKLRQMNTQIASYTQLHHDSTLYNKQAVTWQTNCDFPASFVDPYPAFWSRMHDMAIRCAQLVEQIFATSEVFDPELRQKIKLFFGTFAATMKKLQEIAGLQAKSELLTPEQQHFLKTVVKDGHAEGWYPQLYYEGKRGCNKRDAVVVDVHTDLPSFEHRDPGAVLHWGVGDINLGYFIVDNVMYAGPVFSSYEFTRPIDERWSDTQFEVNIEDVPPPRWAMNSFLCV